MLRYTFIEHLFCLLPLLISESVVTFNTKKQDMENHVQIDDQMLEKTQGSRSAQIPLVGM